MLTLLFNDQSYSIYRDKNDTDATAESFIAMMSSDLVRESINSSDPVILQASGYWLKIIKNIFTNIPMSTNKTVYWNGDIARFILMNLQEFSL